MNAPAATPHSAAWEELKRVCIEKLRSADTTYDGRLNAMIARNVELGSPIDVRFLRTLSSLSTEEQVAKTTVESLTRGIYSSGLTREQHNAQVKKQQQREYEELKQNLRMRQRAQEEVNAEVPPIHLVRASDVQTEKVQWLWRARLARGAITLYEGPPEVGKSTGLCDIAARVTRGWSFPGDAEGREPGNVVMLIAEDDLATTVVPRLKAAGADLDRVFFLGVSRDDKGQPVPFHLSDDGERLRAKCEEVGATFVIVDPLVSFLGSRRGKGVNTNNDMEVRKSLAPLKDLAEKTRVAVAAIRHHRKGNNTNAMEAGGGSVGFAALVRVIVAALPDPDAEDEEGYLLAVAKNNLVAKTQRPAYRYRIVPSMDDPDIACIQWGDAVEMSAGEVLEALSTVVKESKGKVAEAVEFLEQRLAGGVPVPSKDLFTEAKEMYGLSEDAVRRAQQGPLKGRIRPEKEPVPKGRWIWRLVEPQQPATVEPPTVPLEEPAFGDGDPEW